MFILLSSFILNFYWLCFFVHKKKNCTFSLQEILFPPIKRLETVNYLDAVFCITKKNDPEAVTELRKLHNPKKNFGSFFL